VGCDLFNLGYYWEAHETWEGLWHACGRRGTTADFLKGLIKLAAAGVKAREGRPQGVARHAARAAELFASVRAAHGDGDYLGLDLDRLISISRRLASHPISPPRSTAAVEIVFDFELLPSR
jgi:predicted metal-dependent hydrolase